MINVDFAHIHHLMKLGGGALMSIGQGHGVDKALRAVEQALNHPLLETASLENAAGILANFSAGNDLSLFEIESALNYLQERTGNQAEIVMGVTNDINLRDRVEVFLVITGLGAPTLEEALAGVKIPQLVMDSLPEPEAEQPPISAPPIRPPLHQSMPPSSSQNLDIPAFLRKSRQ
jgi:cell division protein FtsZ